MGRGWGGARGVVPSRAFKKGERCSQLVRDFFDKRERSEESTALPLLCDSVRPPPSLPPSFLLPLPVL